MVWWFDWLFYLGSKRHGGIFTRRKQRRFCPHSYKSTWVNNGTYDGLKNQKWIRKSEKVTIDRAHEAMVEAKLVALEQKLRDVVAAKVAEFTAAATADDKDGSQALSSQLTKRERRAHKRAAGRKLTRFLSRNGNEYDEKFYYQYFLFGKMFDDVSWYVWQEKKDRWRARQDEIVGNGDRVDLGDLLDQDMKRASKERHELREKAHTLGARSRKIANQTRTVLRNEERKHKYSTFSFM